MARSSYEVLTGSVPWQGTTAPAVMASLIVDAPTPLEETAPNLPDALEVVLAVALAKEPEDRYPSCTAFADALDEIADELSQQPAVPSIGEAPTLVSGPVALASSGVEKSVEPKVDESVEPSIDAPPAAPASGGASRVVAAAALALSLSAGAAWWWIGNAEPAPEAEAEAPDVVLEQLGCPPLEVDAPERRWLGAATATVVCERLGPWLGGPVRARTPARLLGLPSTPSERTPADPWDDAEARGRAIEAAERAGLAWIDGRVVGEADALTVELTLRGASGESLGTGSGEGAFLGAVRHAVEGLRASGALARVPEPDPQWTSWEGVSDPATANDLLDARQDGHDDEALCERLRHTESLAPWRRALPRVACPSDGAVALDESSGPALAGTARHATADEDALRAAVERLRSLREEEEGPYAQARLASAEAHAWRRLDEPGRARAAAIEALDAYPQSRLALDALFWASITPRDQSVALRHLTAWRPDQYWGLRASSLPPAEHDRALAMLRRAYAVDSSATGASVDLALLLMVRGEATETRSVAARLRRLDRDVAAEQVLAGADFAEGNLGAAIRRLEALLARLEVFGLYVQQDLVLAYVLAEAVLLTGRRDVANAFAERFVLAEPPRLGAWSATLRSATVLCATAEPDVATRALDRLEALAEAGRLGSATAGSRALLTGARAHLAGDDAAALDAVRVLTDERSYVNRQGYGTIVVPILDASGESALATRYDQRVLERGGWFAGVGMANVRSARRAARDGRADEAARLARGVLAALETADIGTPVVDEMRALAD